MLTTGFSTLCALRMRVSMSAIGSLMLMLFSPDSPDYQLALMTPGMSPLKASSRIFERARPNLRNVPAGRPGGVQVGAGAGAPPGGGGGCFCDLGEGGCTLLGRCASTR